MKLESVLEANRTAMEARLWLAPGYTFGPVSVHDERLHRLRHEYPYFGYVEISISGIPDFVMLSNNDDLVAQTYFWFGPNSFETLSMLVWRQLVRESRTVLDVGSFTGLYTLIAAIVNSDAQVHSFEPIPRNFGRLLDNLVVNRLGTRVRTYEVALSQFSGTAWINLVRGPLTMSTGSSLEDREADDVYDRRQVATKSLSDIVPAFDCAKIDVEGHEEAVVKGIDGSAIAEHRPDLLIEIFDRDRLERLLELLPGYSFAVIDDRRLTYEVNSFRLVETGTHNVLLRHASPTALSDFCEPLIHAL